MGTKEVRVDTFSFLFFFFSASATTAATEDRQQQQQQLLVIFCWTMALVLHLWMAGNAVLSWAEVRGHTEISGHTSPIQWPSKEIETQKIQLQMTLLVDLIEITAELNQNQN